jgi:hypothetical protein
MLMPHDAPGAAWAAVAAVALAKVGDREGAWHGAGRGEDDAIDGARRPRYR